jgi:hypothetical protein
MAALRGRGKWQKDFEKDEKSVKMKQLGEKDENGIQSLGVRDKNHFCISIMSVRLS